MKHLIVPQIEIGSTDIKQISEVLNTLEPHKISFKNWAENKENKPNVEFSIAHNNTDLYLQFEVHEAELLAQVAEDNGKVCTDSCVEFFVSFDDGQHYYNLEFNCIGKALVGYRQVGEKPIHASLYTMQAIQRLSSLGTHTREHINGDFRWMLTLVIPISTFWMTNLNSFGGIKAKANFYKCGDNLSVPHYLSWSKIENDIPNFHLPRFFGSIEFA